MSHAGLARWAGLLIEENNSLGPILMVYADEWRAEAEAFRAKIERNEEAMRTEAVAAVATAKIDAMPNVTVEDLFAKLDAIGAAAVQAAEPEIDRTPDPLTALLDHINDGRAGNYPNSPQVGPAWFAQLYVLADACVSESVAA